MSAPLDLKQLNNYFKEHSYAEGFILSSKDFELLRSLPDFNPKELPHLNRWKDHLNSFDNRSMAAVENVAETLEKVKDIHFHLFHSFFHLIFLSVRQI